jgi:hypothetical protein
VRQKGPRFHKRKFVRPARLSGGRGGVLGPLRTPKVIAVGKGPILEKHTPAPDRLRGGGGCRFVVIRASDHSAIVGRVAYFRSPAPFSSAGGRIPQNYRITSSGLKWRPESLPESLPTYSPSGSDRSLRGDCVRITGCGFGNRRSIDRHRTRTTVGGPKRPPQTAKITSGQDA